MKLVVFEIEEWERKSFDAEAVSTFICADLGGSVLKNVSRLRLIATRSTGFDHIDLDHCQSKQITVCNVPSYGENTVAEHVFCCVRSFTRSIASKPCLPTTSSFVCGMYI